MLTFTHSTHIARPQPHHAFSCKMAEEIVLVSDAELIATYIAAQRATLDAELALAAEARAKRARLSCDVAEREEREEQAIRAARDAHAARDAVADCESTKRERRAIRDALGMRADHALGMRKVRALIARERALLAVDVPAPTAAAAPLSGTKRRIRTWS